MTPLETMLGHLIWVATREPWMTDHAHSEWKKYAWARANALAAEDAENYADLPQMLTKAMSGSKESSGSGR